MTHPAQLAPNLLFFKIGAKSPDAPSDWFLTSVPAVRSFFRHEKISVLKMDCEGCEYTIAEDVLKEDPTFFNDVKQFAIEVHLPRAFMAGKTEVDNLARLYKLLKEAGLVLKSAFYSGCNPTHEASGCAPELIESNFPCASGIMCQNYLFARI